MRWTTVALLAIVWVAPTAGAFTVEVEPADASAIDLGVIPYDANATQALQVHVNCTIGEASASGISVSVPGTEAAPGVAVEVAPEATGVEDPVLCTEAESRPFELNATFKFLQRVDATELLNASIVYNVRAGTSDFSGNWTFALQQAYDPDTEVSVVGGYTVDASPGERFSIPVQVRHWGNAPVVVEVVPHVLTPYEPASLQVPRPVPLRTPPDFGASEPTEATVYVLGRTLDEVGNVNRTMALEILVRVTPQDVPFADYYTIERLFVVHVHVQQDHLPRGGDAPGASVAGVLSMAALAAAAWRRRQLT